MLIFQQPGMPEVPWSLQRSPVRTKLCTKRMKLVPKANTFLRAITNAILCHRFNKAWQCFATSVSPITMHASIYPHLLSMKQLNFTPNASSFQNQFQSMFYHTQITWPQKQTFSAVLTLLNSESKTLPCKNPHLSALQLKAALFKNTPKIQNT